jgi:outer membrane receptor protein involved in Fe transport
LAAPAQTGAAQVAAIDHREELVIRAKRTRQVKAGQAAHRPGSSNMSIDAVFSPATLRRALLASTLVCAPLALSAAYAQTAGEAEASADSSNEITVTGSRLVRTDLTAPSPVTIVGEAEIKSSGNVSLEKTLNEFPQLASGNNSAANIGGGSGVLTVNLRGLNQPGAQNPSSSRSLVLVNGRRFIPANSGGEVDLASIPDSLIKRVEIITGGASAVYGSDAIAGAVNFILNDKFEGVEAAVQSGITGRGDAASYKADFTFGASTDDDRGNVVVAATWAKQKPFFQADRAFSRTPLAEINGELVYSGSGNIPGTRVGLSLAQRNQLVGVNVTPTASCPNITGIRFGENGTPLPYCQPQDTYNYSPLNYLQRPQERRNVSALAHYDITDNITAYGEAFYINSKNDSRLAPDSFAPVTPGAAAQTLLVPNYATNPGLPVAVRNFFAANRAVFDADGDGTASIVGAGRRADELGTRDSFYERNQLAFTGGLRGEIGLLDHTWRWDGFYQYQRNRTDTRAEGIISQTRLSLGLDTITNGAGQVVCRNAILGCVPVNIFGLNAITPQAGVFLTPSRRSSDEFVRQIAGASISGVLFELPAGPVSVALGTEYRKDRYNFTPSPQDLAGEYGTGSQTALSGDFDVKEAFGEIRVPILADMPFVDTLAFEGAARYSDYSTVGGVFTWKAGGEYAPISWIRIRGAYNVAIRAPNIGELYSARSIGYVGGADPCARTSATSDSRSAAVKAICVQTGIPQADIDQFYQSALGMSQETGGNPNLKEEKSKTYTIGGVISPPFLRNLNITVDYYNIKITDAVASINNIQTLNDCLANGNINSATCQAIKRLPNGQIDYISVNLQNIGSIKARGLDAQIDYRTSLPALLGQDASLTLQGVGSWMFERSIQTLSTAAPLDCAGYYGGGCSQGNGGFIIPDFKLNLNAAYDNGPVNVRVQSRMVGKIKPYKTVVTNIGNVDPVWYFDLSANFKATDNFTFFAGVDNVFDKQPPILGTTYVGDANVDISLYDVMGRRFFAGARVKF